MKRHIRLCALILASIIPCAALPDMARAQDQQPPSTCAIQIASEDPRRLRVQPIQDDITELPGDPHIPDGGVVQAQAKIVYDSDGATSNGPEIWVLTSHDGHTGWFRAALGIGGDEPTEYVITEASKTCLASLPMYAGSYPEGWPALAQIREEDRNGLSTLAYLSANESEQLVLARLAVAEAGRHRETNMTVDQYLEEIRMIAWMVRVRAFLGLNHYRDGRAGDSVTVMEAMILGKDQYDPLKRIDGLAPCATSNNLKAGFCPEDVFDLDNLYQAYLAVGEVLSMRWDQMPPELVGLDSWIACIPNQPCNPPNDRSNPYPEYPPVETRQFHGAGSHFFHDAKVLDNYFFAECVSQGEGRYARRFPGGHFPTREITPGEFMAELPDREDIGCREETSLDVVFVVDTTGSMGDDIDYFQQSATDLVNELAAAGNALDYRVNLVEYRDHGDAYVARTWGLGFTSDAGAIVGAIGAIATGGGGDWPEAVYSGLMTAIELDWRPEANKVIVLMGDAPPHDPEFLPGGGEHTLSSVIAAALAGGDPIISPLLVPRGFTPLETAFDASSPISIYPIWIGSDGAAGAVFQQLANATGGQLFRARSARDVTLALHAMLEAVMGKPVADAGGPYTAAPGETIVLDAGRSFDQDGIIVRYEWDLDGDGVFELSSDGPVLLYSHATELASTIRLRITDDDARVDIDSAAISISGGHGIDGLQARLDQACSSGEIKKHGICQSLAAKLRAASQSLAEEQYLAARGQLAAFVHQLEAQRGKAIPQATYEDLRARALQVIQGLPEMDMAPIE